MKVFGLSLPIPKKIPIWVGVAVGAVTLVLLFLSKGGADAIASCPGSQVYCPGVGCVSGKDKCTPNSAGGPSAVFSKETFEGQCKPMSTCPGGYRSDGPCLMEFPSF